LAAKIDRRGPKHHEVLETQRVRAGPPAEPRIGGSFAWPLRGRWQAKWAIGLVLVPLLPVTFILLLGYAVAATRAAGTAPSDGPPAWRPVGRVLADGLACALAIAVLTLPFVLLAALLAGPLSSPGLWHSSDPLLHVEGWTVAILIAALPWGIVVLLLMPHATARFAATRRVRHLFDYPASIRSVRRDFASWNIAVAAIVTAWALGLACVGLLFVGLVPGIFYAILVSAHATATLHPEGEDPSAR
jgi:hypothetical protein